MSAAEPLQIRSYRSVFDLERRIYRVDRLRLNPGGIPVRGVVYFIAILLTTLLAGHLPLLGVALGALPWYLRDLGLPIASAAVLTVIRVEGRPFHLAAQALVRYATGPRHLAGTRQSAAPGQLWRPDEILMLPDGSDSRLRRLRYTGPGAVLVTTAHERAERGAGVLGLQGHWPIFDRAQLILREQSGAPAPARGQVIVLARGARLRVR
jgi:hypothetical protein